MLPRIRFVVQYPFSLNYGGLEVQTEWYVKLLRAYSFDVDFINFENKDEEFDILHVMGASVETARVASLARKQGKIVVLSPVFYKKANVQAMKVMSSIMGSLPLVPNSFSLLKNLFKESNLILPNSFAEIEQLETVFKETKDKCQVLRNGVSSLRFKEQISSTSFSKFFNIDKPFMLSVSMIDKRKNTLKLLQAFLLADTKYTLVLIGGFRHFDKTYNEKVRDLIAKNRSRITWVGELEHDDPLLTSAYMEADFHLLPSKLETPGLSSLEAGLAGCRLLVGDCLPVREYFGEFVEYCNPNSVKSIARAIEKLSSAKKHNNDAPVSEFINDNYSWEKIGENLKEIYCTLHASCN